MNKQTFWHNFFSGLFVSLVAGVIVFFKQNGKLPNQIGLFDFFILSLAIFRLIRLLTYDRVTEHIRNFLAKYPAGVGRELWLLLDCPWCTGIWMSLFVIFGYFAFPQIWFFFLVLAMAGLGTLIELIALKIGKDL